MDLFDLQINNEKYAPLSERMRPENFEEFVGQSHIIGENRSILNLIKEDMSVSMIFYGPPGIGKTTLANIISKTTKRNVGVLRDGHDPARARLDRHEHRLDVRLVPRPSWHFAGAVGVGWRASSGPQESWLFDS